MKRFRTIIIAVAALLVAALPSVAQNFPGASGNPSVLSRPGGMFYAPSFAWRGILISGNATTGAQTVTIAGNFVTADGTTISNSVIASTLTPVIFDFGQGAQETVTPTTLTATTCPSGNLGIGSNSAQCLNFTGTFANTHGQSAVVIDGSFGLQTAINYAAQLGLTPATGTTNLGGGGVVLIDAAWAQMGGTNTIITALVPYSNVSIFDNRGGVSRYWNATPTGLALAVPTTLTSQAACDATHQFCSDATVAGSASYAGGALFGCVTYVDIMGNEGPCSLTSASFNDVSAKAIDIALPAASAGAVGWIPYLSLDAGTYAQAYQIPPSSTICTLSTLTPIPSCAITNTTYGSTGSLFGKNALFTGGAQIAAISLNTGQHFPKLASTVQTTVSLTPMTNSSVTYSYAPSNRVGMCPGVSSWNATQEIAAGGISASSTTGIPMSMGTWTIPAGCFNFVGAEFRVSGKITWTDGGASDAMKVIVAWDAAGTNTTTVPTTLCNIANTHTNAAAAQTGYYSCTVRILTTGATGTALVNGSGYFDIATGSAGVLIGGANDTAVAASGSINLTVPGRITVRFSDTGATVTGAQPLEGTLEVAN
jgi:hypothetical protein